jgi:hypothetical protein
MVKLMFFCTILKNHFFGDFFSIGEVVIEGKNGYLFDGETELLDLLKASTSNNLLFLHFSIRILDLIGTSKK